MELTRKFNWLTGISVVVLILAYGGLSAIAADFYYHRATDVQTLKIWRTGKNGETIGGPFVTYYPYHGCDTLGPFKTAAVIKDWKASVGKLFEMNSSADFGFQQGAAGSIEHVAGDEVMELFGRTYVRFPWIDPGEVGLIHVGANITAWIAGGGDETFDIFNAATVNVVNGTCPELPGYVIGTSPLIFSADSGWVNPDPYSGDVVLLGEVWVVSSEPIPTLTEWGLIIMFVIMATGIVWFVVHNRRRIAAA